MESTRQNNNINTIKEVRKLFNDVRKNFSHEEKKRIRKKLRRIEAVYSVLKDKENRGSLTSRQKKMFFNDERYLKNITEHLKNVKKHFKKYRYCLDYLFNEPATLNNDTNVFKDARKLFNERRSSLFHKEINKIREELYKKSCI